MKPKTKLQNQVFELSKTLPKITGAQVKWGYRNCIKHIGRRTKKGVITCLECGHSWREESPLINSLLGVHCPVCATKLQISNTRKRVFSDYEYLCTIGVCGGFQVLRFFYLQSYAKAGEKARHACSEVIQRWIAPDGRYATIARLRPLNGFADTWNFQSKMEIRPEKPLYNAMPTAVYPRQQLIPELKRSGYNGEFYKITPFDLFHNLLANPKAETLLKSGQTELLRLFAKRDFQKAADYWASIRICIRNGYKVKDATLWRDYIDMLQFFGKDLHNSKYVCPVDLQAEHDRYVRKKQEWQERERREKNLKKIQENEAVFNEQKSKYFGIQLTDGVVVVQTLDSVEAIMREGDAMRHCVFANEYYLKPDSLLFSACMSGKRLETVEFSLSKMQVVQSRGVCNKITEYHDLIINLVNEQMPKIQRKLAVNKLKSN